MFGIFEKLKSGLTKTREAVAGRLDRLLGGRTAIDAELLEELEEILLAADVGMRTTAEVVKTLESRRVSGQLKDAAGVRQVVRDVLCARLTKVAPASLSSVRPHVIMVVGVNGVGKTTSIGKLAYHYLQEGKKVVLGAGDTFRAAAADQLAIWGERAGVEVVRHAEGGDPAAVAFDAARAALARNADVLILDTAGRLHTKVNLMEELKKIRRVLAREIPGAPHETLLVLDAATGQNALSQAKLFHAAVTIDGVILTKLDGTARGGVVVAISSELDLPVRYVGLGEGMEDLRPFDAEQFVAALFGEN